MAKQLFSIGYSGFPNINDFIETLKASQIQILIDVRSHPYSSYFVDYDKEKLSDILKRNRIYYCNYARQFGARQEDRSFYKGGRLDFELFSKSEQFLEGVSAVVKSNANIVFMCSEKHPANCHRAILVTRAFSDLGYPIIHLKPNGESLTQKDIEAELVDTYFPNRAQTSMFAEDNLSDAEYIRQAYIRRNDEIGFKLEDLLQ